MLFSVLIRVLFKVMFELVGTTTTAIDDLRTTHNKQCPAYSLSSLGSEK